MHSISILHWSRLPKLLLQSEIYKHNDNYYNTKNIRLVRLSINSHIMFSLPGYFDRDKCPLKYVCFHKRDFVIYIKTVFFKLKTRTPILQICFFKVHSSRRFSIRSILKNIGYIVSLGIH